MNEVTLPDLGFTWNEAIDMLKSTGVDLGLNVLTAIVIFYAGRWVINIVMRGLRTVLIGGAGFVEGSELRDGGDRCGRLGEGGQGTHEGGESEDETPRSGSGHDHLRR